MCYMNLGDEAKARELYHRADSWMKENKPEDAELIRFREEAQMLLNAAKSDRASKPEAAANDSRDFGDGVRGKSRAREYPRCQHE